MRQDLPKSSSQSPNQTLRPCTSQLSDLEQLSAGCDTFHEPPSTALTLADLTVNGIKLRQGDSAYVVTSADFDWAADTREPCALCGQLPDAEDSPMLECENCLRGYHTACLQEEVLKVRPLSPVGEWLQSCTLTYLSKSRLYCALVDESRSVGPIWSIRLLVQEALQEAEWLCSTCQGNDQNPISTNTPAGKLLSGSPAVGLCKVDTIWRMPGEPEEESYFSGQWYLLPEETKQGRKV